MKAKNIFLTALLPLVLAGCTDLTSEVYDAINPSIFPKNESDCEALVTAAAYGTFTNSWWSGIFNCGQSGIEVISDMTTDLETCQWDDAVWVPMRDFNFTANSDGITTVYDTYKRDISKMTECLQRIDKVDLNADTKARMQAELHIARGWLAFILYDYYGPVQIATEAQLADPAADIIIPRDPNDKTGTVKFIEDELTTAINTDALPDTYAASDANWGRFTRGLAYTVLMKFYMHEARWADAEKCARELMKPKYGYALVPNYKDIFTLENERNSEIIWACNETQATNEQIWLASVLSSVYTTKNPNIQKWGGYRMPWAFYNQYDKKDKRLDVIVGDFVGSDGVEYNQKNPGTVLWDGAMPVKYGEDPAAVGEESQIDWIVYRYADVLTSLAEILVRENNSVAQEAVDLLNTVHERAGLDPYTLADFKTPQDFLDTLLLERGKEFFGEGIRHDDLVRAGKYIEYAKKYKGSVTAQDYMNLWPLPQSVIDEGKGKVIQNPGY
jgi:frataxin-like iron-binding protein CyaY